MQTQSRFEVRRGSERGELANSWLHARFSFSFGNWRRPGRDGFGSLRALNEDVIQPGTGFGTHPHRDMDIFVLPIAGVVEHRDSLGNHAFVRPGQVQRMRAGSGIEHSQMNASDHELDHHLQIWLKPRQQGGTPAVEVRASICSCRESGAASSHPKGARAASTWITVAASPARSSRPPQVQPTDRGPARTFTCTSWTARSGAMKAATRRACGAVTHSRSRAAAAFP